MAYADLDYAITLYGEDYVTTSADRDGDGEPDSDLVEAMFDVVSAEIDSYLVGRVDLPFETVPLDLKMRCVDLFIYRICSDAASMSTIKETRFNAAIKWLEMVAKGQIKLTTGSAAATGPNKVASAYITTACDAVSEQTRGARMFSRRNLKDLL